MTSKGWIMFAQTSFGRDPNRIDPGCASFSQQSYSTKRSTRSLRLHQAQGLPKFQPGSDRPPSTAHLVQGQDRNVLGLLHDAHPLAHEGIGLLAEPLSRRVASTQGLPFMTTLGNLILIYRGLPHDFGHDNVLAAACCSC